MKSKPVDRKKVISNIRSTDMTDDPDWIAMLIADIKAFPKWRVGMVPIHDIDNYCDASDSDIADYSDGVGNFPPVVLVPGDEKKKWTPIDGGHRCAATAEAGYDTVLAYYPDV